MTEELIERLLTRIAEQRAHLADMEAKYGGPLVHHESGVGLAVNFGDLIDIVELGQSLSARVAELEGLAGALIAKLDECAPHIANAFAMEHFRDRPYTGPQYRDELNALRASLTKEAVVDG